MGCQRCDWRDVVQAFVRGRIVEEEALRFHLYRHWSLYESIMYSPFVASRLRTWSEGGKASVEQLLAKMGLPLREAVKPFRCASRGGPLLCAAGVLASALAAHDCLSHAGRPRPTDFPSPVWWRSAMDPDVRKEIPRKLDQWVALFSLSDIKFDSFKLHFGYRDSMGASDMVSAVTAILESGTDQTRQFWAAMDTLVSDLRTVSSLCALGTLVSARKLTIQTLPVLRARSSCRCPHPRASAHRLRRSMVAVCISWSCPDVEAISSTCHAMIIAGVESVWS